jgi:HlyD family secretion protein
MKRPSRRKAIGIVVALVAAVAALVAWESMNRRDEPNAAFVSGNGRIEATEINASTKLAGRIEQILVREGDFVKAGQPLVRMQVDTLKAQRDEARAKRQQAITAVDNAKAQVLVREADLAAAEALVAQYESALDAAQRRLARSETLSIEGASSLQELDDDRARVRSASAAVKAGKAQAVAAEAAVKAARTQVIGAEAAVNAATATVARIDADIEDSVLTSPVNARVQYLVAQTGEVLGAGGVALNLIDLSDVYMTFFVPEAYAGRVAMGNDVRIVLDTAPSFPIPARVSFVSATAQFTPRTVETASEREKLMFRVRAQIPRELLQAYPTQVKTGLPGVAWVKLDPNAEWPDSLRAKVGE